VGRRRTIFSRDLSCPIPSAQMPTPRTALDNCRIDIEDNTNRSVARIHFKESSPLQGTSKATWPQKSAGPHFQLILINRPSFNQLAIKELREYDQFVWQKNVAGKGAPPQAYQSPITAPVWQSAPMDWTCPKPGQPTSIKSSSKWFFCKPSEIARITFLIGCTPGSQVQGGPR